MRNDKDIGSWETFLGMLKSMDHDLSPGNRMERFSEGAWRTNRTEFELRRQFDSWPPDWLRSNESLQKCWREEWCRSLVLWGVSHVFATTGPVFSCLPEIVHDMMQRRRFMDNSWESQALAKIFWVLSTRDVEGIEDDPKLPRILWDSAVVLFSVQTWPPPRQRCGGALCKMLCRWPEMNEWLKENEEFVKLLRGLLRDKSRSLRAAAFSMLMRIDGVDFPCCGKVGDERMAVLRRMDHWVWRWELRNTNFHEGELRKMRGIENVDLDELGRWEAFYDRLKGLDDHIERRALESLEFE
jgi:hypothetical protein